MYKHPEMKTSEFLYEMIRFIERHVPNAYSSQQSQSQRSTTNSQSTDPNILIVGDFNIDFNKKEKRMEQMETFGYDPLFTQTSTHDSGNQIDWAFKSYRFQHQISHILNTFI